jgi:cytochrome c
MNRNKMVLTVMLGSAVALYAGAAAAADDVTQLLAANGCTACHAVGQKLVGPAFSWVAYRHKDEKNAADVVATFIIAGGTGYWQQWTGGVPMPSHPNLTKEQAVSIAKWVLSQAPEAPPHP